MSSANRYANTLSTFLTVGTLTKFQILPHPPPLRRASFLRTNCWDYWESCHFLDHPFATPILQKPEFDDSLLFRKSVVLEVTLQDTTNDNCGHQKCIHCYPHSVGNLTKSPARLLPPICGPFKRSVCWALVKEW